MIPFGKQRARVVSRAGRSVAFTPPSTKSAEEMIGWAAKPYFAEPLIGPVTLEIRAYFPLPVGKSKDWKAFALAGSLRPHKKPDWDNVGKLVSDALNGIAYFDDCQVVDARVRKYYAEVPRLEIEVSG